MNSLEIIKPGMMTSIQDMGRTGLAYYAVPMSGVMDSNAAKVALLLLNKPETSPLIECTNIAPHILFHTDTKICLTGVDFGWTINHQKVSINTVISIQKGDLLKGKFAKNGLRGYIAIQADFDLVPIHQSYATYINAGIGGYEGRLLKKGDFIPLKKAIALEKGIIPIYKGPEFHLLTPLAQKHLLTHTYTISPDSSRMGARLNGLRLDSTTYQLPNSLPILPGFIQLPPNGMPIVILQDGQISGGYPRIAYIRPTFLSIFNQLPLGSNCRFVLEEQFNNLREGKI